MLTNLIKGFFSRGEAKKFISHLMQEENSETETLLYQLLDEAKSYHVGKALGKRIKLNSYLIDGSDTKPNFVEGSIAVTILYLSKEYTGEPDSVGDNSIEHQAGSMISLAPEEYSSLVLGKTTSGENYRLFAFWANESQ